MVIESHVHDAFFPCVDSYFQLRLGGVVACSELIVSTLCHC